MKTTIKLLAVLAIAALPFHPLQAEDAVMSKKAIISKLRVEGVVSFPNILFKINSTELANESSVRQVKEIVAALSEGEYAKASFIIEGHTCDLGSDAHNQKLSERRAVALGNFLADKGIATARLEAVGLGESKPEVPNTSEESRQQNRRVVLKLKPANR